jgi:putative CocE/NonD family hydrolase
MFAVVLSTLFLAVGLFVVFKWPLARQLAIGLLKRPPVRKLITDLYSNLYLPLRYGIKVEHLMVPMRDGVLLATDVFMPGNSSGPFPSILMRTCYFKTVNIGDNDPKIFFTKNGYAVVIQHVRGRFASEGVFTVSRHEGDDGYDTMNWLAGQPWSTGEIGTFGCSYLGENQFLLAKQKHPNHRAIIAQCAGGAVGKTRGSFGYFGIFETGVLNLASALGWFTEHGAKRGYPNIKTGHLRSKIKKNLGELPVVELAKRTVEFETDYEDFVSHRLADPWWEEMGYISDKDSFSTPALHVNGWFDQTVGDTFLLAELMKENATNRDGRHQSVIIGPGGHCQFENDPADMAIGDLPVPGGHFDYRDLYLSWFDYWLKGLGPYPPQAVAYRIFMPGLNKWLVFDQWPPESSESFRFYLHSGVAGGSGGGILNTLPPAGEEAPDTFNYDPANPVPTIGGSICCTGLPEYGPGSFDQRSLESRSDILIYTSKVLSEKLILAGRFDAVLFISSSAKDTDFTIKLLDVWPDGRAFNIQDGVLRTRYRNGFEKEVPLEANAVNRITIRLRPIAYQFNAGHRVRVHISSSNFPRLARNLNTGEKEYASSAATVAQNSVYHDSLRASHLQFSRLIADGVL